MRLLRLCLIVIVAVAGALSCREETVTLPTTPGNIVLDGSISGTVVAFGTGAPVGTAALQMGGAAAVTDPAGRFTMTGVPSSGEGVLVATAPGFVMRAKKFALAPARTGAVLDMIADQLPFSLEFYRFFVRNGFEGSTLERTAPWTIDPSFYVRTIVENTTTVVDPAVVAAIEANFRQSVPSLSGGRRQVAAFESGTDPRPETPGWVNVLFSFDLQGALGRATVGGNQGTMWIRYGVASNAQTNSNNCLTPEVFVADHEITHTMGYWHTFNIFADTFSGPGCPGAPRPSYTEFHAGVMYSRPFGNQDPDLDPFELVNFTAPAPRRVVDCHGFRR
jgi:hypothetical protein